MKYLKAFTIFWVLSCYSFVMVAQSNIEGNWLVGAANTVVKMERSTNTFSGTIFSSDNPKAPIGKLMVKGLQKVENSWKGMLYSPKRKEWYTAEFIPKEKKLVIQVNVGLFRKTIIWTKK